MDIDAVVTIKNLHSKAHAAIGSNFQNDYRLVDLFLEVTLDEIKLVFRFQCHPTEKV